mmetsp:Transcript_14848/g.44051  ORF Transcript_14848/g.44051 Transcript_14848/m.44051 type:complete len:564 (+) Transcript_14848:915-2606(+)
MAPLGGLLPPGGRFPHADCQAGGFSRGPLQAPEGGHPRAGEPPPGGPDLCVLRQPGDVRGNRRLRGRDGRHGRRAWLPLRHRDWHRQEVGPAMREARRHEPQRHARRLHFAAVAADLVRLARGLGHPPRDTRELARRRHRCRRIQRRDLLAGGRGGTAPRLRAWPAQGQRQRRRRPRGEGRADQRRDRRRGLTGPPGGFRAVARGSCDVVVDQRDRHRRLHVGLRDAGQQRLGPAAGPQHILGRCRGLVPKPVRPAPRLRADEACAAGRDRAHRQRRQRHQRDRRDMRLRARHRRQFPMGHLRGGDHALPRSCALLRRGFHERYVGGMRRARPHHLRHDVWRLDHKLRVLEHLPGPAAMAGRCRGGICPRRALRAMQSFGGEAERDRALDALPIPQQRGVVRTRDALRGNPGVARRSTAGEQLSYAHQWQLGAVRRHVGLRPGLCGHGVVAERGATQARPPPIGLAEPLALQQPCRAARGFRRCRRGRHGLHRGGTLQPRFWRRARLGPGDWLGCAPVRCIAAVVAAAQRAAPRGRSDRSADRRRRGARRWDRGACPGCTQGA